MGTTPETPSGADEVPWLEWPLGARVVVRRRLPDGGYTDVLGELVYRRTDGVEVRTHDGTERIDAVDIALGKVIPPPPERRIFRERR